jgi:hypothetical protein
MHPDWASYRSRRGPAYRVRINLNARERRAYDVHHAIVARGIRYRRRTKSWLRYGSKHRRIDSEIPGDTRVRQRYPGSDAYPSTIRSIVVNDHTG